MFRRNSAQALIRKQSYLIKKMLEIKQEGTFRQVRKRKKMTWTYCQVRGLYLLHQLPEVCHGKVANLLILWTGGNTLILIGGDIVTFHTLTFLLQNGLVIHADR